MPPFDFVLGNRYRLLSPLGAGGMASVFAATDERLGRRVAVKLLADNLLRDSEFVKRFQREAEAAANLTHANIVSVYDVGEDGGRHYIVMELVNGRNLKDMILDRGALPLAQTITIGAQVLDGLAYAHEHGLVHRDIKPQNILVTREGVAKLADFGIAKAVDNSSATQTAVVLGSAHYISPEQASGEQVSRQSDLYSVGVVLYEMSTGSVPFEGSNLLSVAARHLHDEPRPPSSVNPEVPPDLNRVILTALAKDPNARFDSAAEMRERVLETAGSTGTTIDVGATQPVGRQPIPLDSASTGATDLVVARPAVLRYMLWGFLIAVAALVVDRGPSFLPSATYPWTSNSLPIAAAVLGGLAVLCVCLGFVERGRSRYTVDQHAVTVEIGIFGHHRDAVPLPAIVNLQLHQSPLARLFHVGTIVLTTVQVPGQGPVALRLRDVSHASDVYDTILKRIGSGRRLRYEADSMLDEFGP